MLRRQRNELRPDRVGRLVLAVLARLISGPLRLSRFVTPGHASMVTLAADHRGGPIPIAEDAHP